MRTFRKIKSVLEDLLIAVVCIGAVVGVGWLTIKLVRFAWKEITKPAPVCYWKYVDTEGNEGTAEECLNSWGKLYCGTDNKAWAVISVEEVCE